MNQKASIEMTIYADVQITDEICEGIADQYPDLWERIKNDPEEIACVMLGASDLTASARGSNEDIEDWWDGVGKMQGLITNVELV
jgi:hypothetical protein